MVLSLLFTDDENSHVHGILTSDNLFDGTISTKTEHFYIEPAKKYSKDLDKRGIHSVMYKVSDVKYQNLDGLNDNGHHQCASERLHTKLKHQQRQKEWQQQLSNSKKLVKSNDNAKNKISDSDYVADNERTSDMMFDTFHETDSRVSGKSDIYNYYKVLLGDNRINLIRKRRKKRWLNDEVRGK